MNQYAPIPMKPALAAMKQAMNILGKMQLEVASAYPDNNRIAKVYESTAKDLRALRQEVKSQSEDQAWVELKYFGAHEGALKFINDHLFQPVADANQAGKSDDYIKGLVMDGLEAMAKSFDESAIGLTHENN